MNVTVYLTKNYERNPATRLRENKPNSNPIQTQTNPIPKKPKINVNYFPTKDYANICPCGAPKNKANSKPISQKAKMNANLIAPQDYENLPLRSLPENKPNLKVARFAIVMILALAMYSTGRAQNTDNLASAVVMCKLSTLGSIANN